MTNSKVLLQHHGVEKYVGNKAIPPLVNSNAHRKEFLNGRIKCSKTRGL